MYVFRLFSTFFSVVEVKPLDPAKGIRFCFEIGEDCQFFLNTLAMTFYSHTRRDNFTGSLVPLWR